MKLPLINSSNILVKILGYFLYAFIILMVLGAILPAPSDDNLAEASEEDASNANAETLSVVVDGWNFSANLDDRWRRGSSKVEKGVYDVTGWVSEANWDSIVLNDAFWLPKEGVENPSVNDKNDVMASVGIGIYTIPKEVRNDYASNIFLDYAGEFFDPKGNQKVTDTTFDGHPAQLWELKADKDVVNEEGVTTLKASTNSELIVLITDDTLISISAEALRESDMDANTIVEKILVSPA